MKLDFSHLPVADIELIITALNPAQTKLVGGVVRDVVMGRKVGDIDLSTTAKPEQTMARLEKAGIKVIPTGIDFGTVTAVVNGKNYEITTCRLDVKTNGRHAEVVFTDDFSADAARRDFTCNALYADLDGTVTDYFDGVADARAGHIRFIGNAYARITEDYLRILRYFRFYALFGKTAMDAATLEVIESLAPRLTGLSAERITTELLKTLAAPNPVPVWRAMQRTGVLENLQCVPADMDTLAEFVNLFPTAHEPLYRVLALYQAHLPRAVLDNRHVNLSNAQLAMLEETLIAKNQLTEHAQPVRHVAYRLGSIATLAALRLLAALRGTDKTAQQNWLAQTDDVAAFDLPEFPLTGKDLLALGVPAGPKVGQILTAVEDWWLENNFPEREVCLQEAQRLV